MKPVRTFSEYMSDEERVSPVEREKRSILKLN